MQNRTIVALAIVFALGAVPAVAQEADTTDVVAEEAAEAVEEIADETAEAVDAVADATAEAADAVEETVEQAAAEAEEAIPVVERHDWEFALAPTEHGAGATGDVKVTEGEGAHTFVIEVDGLPAVDQLDQPNRDVNAYTVWIVPSKDRVPESTLAGVLNADPETGVGTFQGTTSLATFGVIVTATADGVPERIGGVPVLTGIPVTPEVTEPEPAGEGAPAADESAAPAGEAPAAEATTEDAPVEDVPTPDAPAQDDPQP